MDMQTIINFGVGGVIAGLGWFARTLWDATQSLQQNVHQIEVELPKSYVRRDEFQETMKEIKSLVERIYDKLDGKADK